MDAQRRYFGWDGIDDVAREYAPRGRNYEPDVAALEQPFPTDEEVLFASYGQEQAYSGDARVLFVRDGVLYEAGGSHCSCNGLEGQWSPSPVTWEALRLRPGLEGGTEWREHTAEAHEAWDALVAAGQDTRPPA